MNSIQEERFSIAGPPSNPYPPPPTKCHGLLHNAVLVIPSLLLVIYLAFHAKKNILKLTHSRSFIMIAYYVLLCLSLLLNLAWSSLQAWQCTPGKEVSWNLLSMFTASGMLCLEISVLAFLLQDNFSTGLETLPRTFLLSAFIVALDFILKAIFVFGFGVPLFDAGETTHGLKWGLWTTHKLLLTGVYGFILFVHYSKWRDKLPPRPAFFKYIIAMFVMNGIASFAAGLAGSGAGFGLGLYSFMDMCYHSLYLPFLYVTFLADFFQEEDMRLDNAYYSEMKDAGFFDADWDSFYTNDEKHWSLIAP